MGPLSQPWVWARLPGHTVPSPGLVGLARLRGFHPQLAEDGPVGEQAPPRQPQQGCCPRQKRQVLFWKQKTKSTLLEHPDSKKNALKLEKFPNVDETLKLVESLKEAKVSKTEMPPMVADPCALAKTTDGAKVELDRGGRGRSLLQLPLMAVKSVSMTMVSALQSGWQMCSWKSSVSSTSVPSQMRAGSPLQSPEAEMLREVYLVLWAIRKQLRQLARRQERCRRRHICAHTCPQPDPVQGPKQNAQSPL